MKSVAFLTLGCKVNSYETEKMMQQFVAKGYQVREFDDIADIYVINTCTVTNVADRKSRKMLHRARRRNDRALVVAAGCYVDSAKEEELADNLIDMWVSNKEKGKLADLADARLEEMLLSGGMKEGAKTGGTDAARGKKTEVHTRAYLKIQDGCNQFCTYCIIPYVRGRIKSRGEGDILEEAKRLAGEGKKELVLTGIHLSSYGVDTAGEKDFTKLRGVPLLELAEKLSAIKGIERIRFGSLEPRLITEEFVRGLSQVPQICPHFHLSLQSGCDETLRRMNRHYTTAEYREKTELLRTFFDRPAITTDVIVGFPQESEEEFHCTKAFLEEIAFAQMHIFKYSRRQGTKADGMSGQVEESIKNSRSGELLALGRQLEGNYRRQFVGRRAEILFEESVDIEEKEYEAGYTREYIRVALPLESAGGREEEENLHNKIKSVKIGEALNEEYMKVSFSE